MRDRGWRRKKNFSKASRKRDIDLAVFWHPYMFLWNDQTKNYRIGYYKNLHQYSKNKIHCSCAMCSAKTKNKGRRRFLHGNYAPSRNYKISDQRKINSMNDDIKNYEYE